MAPGPTYDTVSFLSDYGTADEFVGVVKSVLRSIAPAAAVIDLTHEVAPFDVRAGSLVLARAMQYVPPGVVLAVVDPGVGTARKAVAVEVADGEGVLVGPDNGLLAPAVAMAGGAGRAVALTRDDWHLAAPGPTFAGRDVFAPVAAHLCNGVPLTELGEPVDPAALLPGLVPLSRTDGDRVVAEVLWIDRFGNAQLNLGPDDVPGTDRPGTRLSLVLGGARRIVGVADTYASIRPGELGLVVDSYGLLAVCADRASAAAELGLDGGQEVVLEPLDGAEERANGVRTPVQLGPRSGPGRPTA